jgi:hypothetical protein
MAESPIPTFPVGVIGTKLVDSTGLVPAAMVDAGHVNVVHQFSYGELQLLPEEVRNFLSQKDRQTIQGGTYQFWKLVTILSGKADVKKDGTDPLCDESTMKRFMETCPVTKSNNTTLTDRIRAKVDIINALKRRGILLIDCSVHPIYKGFTVKETNKKTGKPYTTKKNKLPIQNQEMVLRASWENYTKYLVESYQPDKLLILGKTVEKAIGGEANIREAMRASNIEYLGARHHPSYNHLQSYEKFGPHLKFYRNLGLECEAAARL